MIIRILYNIALSLVGFMLATGALACGGIDGHANQPGALKTVTIHYRPISFAVPKSKLKAIHRTPDLLAIEYSGGAVVSLSEFDQALGQLKGSHISAQQWFDCVFETSSTACGTFPDRLLSRARTARKIRKHGVKSVQVTREHELHILGIEYVGGRYRAIITTSLLDGGYYELYFKQVEKPTVTSVLDSIDMNSR